MFPLVNNPVERVQQVARSYKKLVCYPTAAKKLEEEEVHLDLAVGLDSVQGRRRAIQRALRRTFSPPWVLVLDDSSTNIDLLVVYHSRVRPCTTLLSPCT